MAGERIGLFGREDVVPSRVCLVADLVKGQTTLAGLEEVFVPPAPLALDCLLPEGSDSCLAFGSVLPLDCTRLIGNLRTKILLSVLKGLRSVYGVVALLNSPVKVRIGICRNLGRGLVVMVGFGVEASGGVGSSRIQSAGFSPSLVYTTSIQVGW